VVPGCRRLRPWRGDSQLTRWERGWLFLSGHKAFKDLAPQIKAAEVLYFIPFFVWLAENPLQLASRCRPGRPRSPSFGSTLTTGSTA
jgi:hypothetical protein